MKQAASFTARELYALAYLDGRHRIYGLPDGFDDIPEEVRSDEVEKVCNRLEENGLVTLNFDGHAALTDVCKEIIASCSECDSCMTVNLHKAAGNTDDYIFWRMHDSIMMARADGEFYHFTKPKYAEVKEILASISMNTAVNGNEETVISCFALEKAKKRIVSGQVEEAIHILHQNGASEKLVYIIADALQERAGYVGLLCMDNHGDRTTMQESAFLNSRGVTLEISSCMINLRNCVKFTMTSEEMIKSKIADCTSFFFDK